MAMKITNRREIMQLIRTKQTLEANLAKDIHDVFDSTAPRLNLARFVRGMCLYMCADIDMDTNARRTLQVAMDKEDKLAVWKKIVWRSPWGLQEFFAPEFMFPRWKWRLDASDCSDLIRLAGEWVEQAEKRGTRCWNLNIRKDLRRKGLPSKRFYKEGEVISREPRAQLWAKKAGHYGAQYATRDRGKEEREDPTIEIALWPYWRMLNAPYEKGSDRKTAVPRAKADKTFSGMGTMGRAQGLSNVKRLELLFGSVLGQDISGTTTDTVFAFQKLGRNRRLLHPGYFLLPLGTIAHNMHHALMEVAFALSLNDVVDYRVGFYGSLMPKGGLPAELGRIESLLTAAENAMAARRLHLMCYYKDGSEIPTGAFQFNRSELPELKATVVGTEMLRAAFNNKIGPYPKEEQIRKLLPSSLERKLPSVKGRLQAAEV